MNTWKALDNVLDSPALIIAYAFAIFSVAVLISWLSLLIWGGRFALRVSLVTQIIAVPALLPIMIASFKKAKG